MEFLISTPEITKKRETFELFNILKSKTVGRPGYCYYKYPIAGGSEHHLPEIVIVDLEYGITAIDVYDYNLESITGLNDEIWSINNEETDSPILKLEDYIVNLNNKFQKYRPLRNKVQINTYIILANVSERDFKDKFTISNESNIIFNNYRDIDYDKLWNHKSQFNAEESKLFLAVAQGAGRLNSFKKISTEIKTDKIGKAINLIDTKLASLDKIQHAAAIQIPDGPQRIRGMAGTGKTIILTMKAALLHSRFPDAKVLYTFHTQSLYNQIKNLITKFYRESEEKDPNWDNLMVLHSWGGRYKEGVYYRTCLRNSILPQEYSEVKYSDDPLDEVCKNALKNKISEEFDFVLIDEAQDLPPSFFQMVYEATKAPKRIIFAYDELQTLNNLRIADAGELFGANKDGTKKVDFTPGVYDSGIEMDYVLKKSYRNPHEMLMVAHGLGLGIHNKLGDMQIIEDKEIWNAIGYEVEGELQKGQKITIKRPLENSISIVHEIYNGEKPILEYQSFSSKDDEFNWIAEKISNDINVEGVAPHHIIVISLDQATMVESFISLQKKLFDKGIPNILPGFKSISKDKFAEEGFVTLSTVYKAKGNEAYIVYVMNFDFLYDYVNFVKARNRAFTSISRSKGWCRISGVGKKMDRAIVEIQKIQKDIPEFKFTFPDPERIKRKLSTEEQSRRKSEIQKAKKTFEDLLKIEDGAIEKVSKEEKIQMISKLFDQLSKKDIQKLISKLDKSK